MRRKFIGRYDIERPTGERESFEVRPKSGHFKTKMAAENAARRMGHIKLQSRRYPIGSHKIAYAEPVNVLSDREIGRKHKKGSLFGFEI